MRHRHVRHHHFARRSGDRVIRAAALTVLFAVACVGEAAHAQAPIQRRDAVAAARGNPHLVAMIDRAERAYVDGTTDPTTQEWCRSPADLQLGYICQYVRQLHAVPELEAQRRANADEAERRRAASEAEAQRARDAAVAEGRVAVQRALANLQTIRAEALATTAYAPETFRGFEARIAVELDALTTALGGAYTELGAEVRTATQLGFAIKSEIVAHMGTLLPSYGANVLGRAHALTWRDGAQTIRLMMELIGKVAGDAMSAGLVHGPRDPPEPPDLPTAIAYENRRLGLVLQEIDEVRHALILVCVQMPEREAVLREEIPATRGPERRFLEQQLSAMQAELRDRRRFLEAHGIRPGAAACSEHQASR